MSRFTETPRQLLDEIEQLRAALNAVGTPIFRTDIIEECARVVEDRRWGIHTPLEKIAAAIRALKNK